MNPRLKAYLYLLFVSLIWGVASAVIKFTLGGISPLPFLTYRFFISAILAFIFFVFARKNLRVLFENPLDTFIYGATSSALALGLLFIGLARTSVLDASLIGAFGPMITAIFGVIFLKEQVTFREKLGIFVAFLGTVVTVLGPILRSGYGLGSTQLTGNFFVIGYLLVNSISSVWAKKLNRKGVNPFALANASFVIGFLLLLPLAIFRIGPGALYQMARGLEIKYQLGVFYMALISGTAAYALWIRGLRTIEISEAGVFMYLIPIFAAPLGVFWLGEKITSPFLVGAFLVALGVIIAEFKRKRYNSTKVSK